MKDKGVRVKRVQEQVVEMTDTGVITLKVLRDIVAAANNFGLYDGSVVMLNGLALNGRLSVVDRGAAS